jgi:hypothetical protein
MFFVAFNCAYMFKLSLRNLGYNIRQSWAQLRYPLKSLLPGAAVGEEITLILPLKKSLLGKAYFKI